MRKQRRSAFKELLGIPDEVAVVAGVTVGTAMPEPNASRASSRMSLRRRELEEVVRWEHW
jgi:nitroreductase